MVNVSLTSIGNDWFLPSHNTKEASMTVRALTKRVTSSLKVAAVAAVIASSATSAFANAGFQRWVSEFRGVATQSGITRATFDRAFANVTAPDREVLE